MTSWVSHKTIDPGQVSFLFGFSFQSIMFLTYIKFERNLLLGKNHETVAYAFKKKILLDLMVMVLNIFVINYNIV